MRKINQMLVPLAFMSFIPVVSMAQQLPGKHPGYLHALSDLRTARWFLFHQPGDSIVSGDEDVAITEVDAAIAEIKKGAIDDGKDVNDHPAVDIKEHGSRLLKASETLQKARADINQEEDNPEARTVRHAALDHIGKAISTTDAAHWKWLHEGKK